MALTPAPLGKRIAAAIFDGFVLLVLCVATFLGPLLTRGFVVPMWGVLVVLVGYAVLPLAALKRTLGMQLFNLELARLDGHAVDLANLLFREFVGRGLFVRGDGGRGEPALVDAAAVSSQGVVVGRVELESTAGLEERARHPGRREAENAAPFTEGIDGKAGDIRHR